MAGDQACGPSFCEGAAQALQRGARAHDDAAHPHIHPLSRRKLQLPEQVLQLSFRGTSTRLMIPLRLGQPQQP